MDGGTTLKASGSSDFMIFCKLYLLSFPIILLIKGCFSIHGIFFCWNLNLFPVLLMLTHLRITWSLLKGYLFSPLWDPGSVFTILYLEMTYFFRSSKVLFKYIPEKHQLDTMEEMRTTNCEMLQIWQRKQKHWGENSNTWKGLRLRCNRKAVAI